MVNKGRWPRVTCVLPPYNNRFNTDSAWPSRLLLGWVSTESVSRQKSRRNPWVCVLSRPQTQGPQLRGLIERYTDGIKGGAAPKEANTV